MVMGKDVTGNDLCNNDIGHDLYKPLSKFTPSVGTWDIPCLFPGCQQMFYCKKSF